MLEPLPHVGAIIMGDDDERVVRLLRMLRDQLDSRTKAFAAVGAATLGEYRAHPNGNPTEPRLLLLLDNFGGFAESWNDHTGGRQRWFKALQSIIQLGRPLGIHVVISADRPGAVPTQTRASVPRRVALRLSEKSMYETLGVADDVLDETSEPGRAVLGKLEVQVAILGGVPDTGNQIDATYQLASALEAIEHEPAPGISALPEIVRFDELGAAPPAQLLIGIGENHLEPVGIRRSGTFLVSGPPQSGRSNLVHMLAQRAIAAGMSVHHIGPRRSAVRSLSGLSGTSANVEEVEALTGAFAETLDETAPGKVAVVIENLGEWNQPTSSAAIAALIKSLVEADQLVIGEAETSQLGPMSTVQNLFRNARRGIVLQPDVNELSNQLKLETKHVNRFDYPAGRGIMLEAGKPQKVQVAIALEEAPDVDS